jgi:2-polyprenyl-3-methyl-5-hydroxy-6-metoxy-1,4-benzoquinol methylase
VEAGRGGGHLARCAALVRDLRALGREAFLLLGGAAVSPALAPLLAELDPWIVQDPGAGSWGFVVLDRFRTPAPEYRLWASRTFLVGIDEGGPCRDSFDFLIDLLPGPPGRSAPNLFDPRLLPLPDTLPPRSSAGTGPLKVLISFGAEDAAGLGRDCAAALCSLGDSPGPAPGFHITLIDPRPDSPPGAPQETGADGSLTLLRGISGLAGHLGEYDLLITHFGLSAFEALHAGTPVLLVSPGPYHERLAGTADFFSAGIGKQGVLLLKSLLGDFLRRPAAAHDSSLFFKTLQYRCRTLARRYGLGPGSPPLPKLAEFLAAFEPAEPTALLTAPPTAGRPCPGCGGDDASASPSAKLPAAKLQPVLARFPDRSFHRCRTCGLIFMGRINAPPIEYAREYFFEFYQKQYGKTYIEDFPQLMTAGKLRLSRIRSLLPRGPSRPEHADRGGACPGKLLDIGCAYGPFLKAAAREGFDVCGIDPAEEAIRYVRDSLGFSAFRGYFPPPGEGGTDQPPFSPASFSVITLWYVIEHIKNLEQALAEAGKLLAKGGVLAFSTPSCSGISGRTSLRGFLEKSPADHWTIWNPRIARRVLKRRGFRLKKVVSTGHHPERFPLLGKHCGKKESPAYRFMFLLSRIFGLGDTFEAYAVKS